MTKKTHTAVSTDDREGRESREVRALVLWARENRIAVSEVQVGMTRLVMADLSLAGTLVPQKPSDDELRQNLYARFGGAALDEAAAVTDDDSEPEYDGADEDE